MSLYVIILNHSNATVWQNVRAEWPQHHIMDDRIAFVSADNTLTADIARAAGIGPDEASGIVVQMDYFSGHTSSSLVEWISKNNA